MSFKKVDRLPFYDNTIWSGFGYWDETLQRWYREGLPIGIHIYDYFGFDKREDLLIDCGPIPRFIPKTLYENHKYKICLNEDGIKMKILKSSTSMPSFIDFPVKTSEDWEMMKNRFNPHDSRRYPKTWSDELIEYYKTLDCPLRMRMVGLFGEARNLLGLEGLLKAFYRDPDLVHDIMTFWTDFLIKTYSQALKLIKIDFVYIFEDMAYKNGPHISPKLFEEFILPNYKKLINFIKDHGVKIIAVDCDGNINVLIPLLLEAGVNCLFPLEVAAGMDAVKLREQYGNRLLLIGNIDKRALSKGKEEINNEINRKFPLAEEGGYLPSVDHSVPADVPLKNYLYYIKKYKDNLNY